MPAKKPGYSVTLWLNNEDIEHLKRLSEATQIKQTDLMSRILHAGLKTIVENNYRLILPLSFRFSEGEEKEDRRASSKSPPLVRK